MDKTPTIAELVAQLIENGARGQTSTIQYATGVDCDIEVSILRIRQEGKPEICYEHRQHRRPPGVVLH